MYNRSTEIRHLSSADVYKLGQIMEPMQFWKKLMRTIPKDVDSGSITDELKYNNDHVRLIECANAKDGRTCTEILLDEWGCSGRRRPTLGLLLDLLIKAQLFRAADFVALNFLNEPPPKRPDKGPAAKVDISIPLESQEVKEIENMLDDISYPGTNTLVENRKVQSNLNNQDYYEKLGQGDKKLDIVQSDLMKFSSCLQNIPNLTDLVHTNSDYIPAISALNCQNFENVLPNLSALNIEDDKKDSRTEDMTSASLSASTDSKTSVNDSNLLTYPNLSMLDQSDLNESSLTNVTETSEENVLFAQSEIAVSVNIPCLSALNNKE